MTQEDIAQHIAFTLGAKLMEMGITTTSAARDIHTSGARTFFNMSCEQEFGIFAAVIDSAEISAYFAKLETDKTDEDSNPTDETYWVQVSLSYSHPGGGTNGSTIMTIWLNSNFGVVATRLPGLKGDVK